MTQGPGMIYDPLQDPALDILRRKREIERSIARADSGIDAQEMRERESAAQAYAGENEAHFASYLQDCVNQSVKANEDIRNTQAHCWRVYCEDEPINYSRKDAWQSRIVVPKPFGTVQYGASAIKRAFTPKFLSVANSKNPAYGEFWKRVMDYHLNEQHGKFVVRFTDATTMALAVGISMEMIPRWLPGAGLSIELIPPWHIHRDPDAAPRDPQSGLYWIHQEWLDWHVLKAGETSKKYQDVNRVREAEQPASNNPWLTPEAIANRKKMIWERAQFRPMIHTSEFWGAVLSPHAEMLLPKARFTTAAGRVIEKPRAVDYRTLRWLGTAFSPMPDLLKFNGRGLLEGILSLWESMCNLMCLHNDNLQWVVNPMTEINVDALKDPTDTETWPGKEYLTNETISGQQAVRTVQRRSNTNDVLANMQYHDQNYQRGSFVSDAVQGLPGYRKDMTYREAAMNLDQALGVYSLMGENIENGAIGFTTAAAEIIQEYAVYNDYLQIFTEDELAGYGIRRNPQGKNGIEGLPPIDGSFHVSGIQTLMKDNETLTNIKQVILPLANHPRFGKYIDGYRTLKAIEIRTNMKDEQIIVDEAKAKEIDLAEIDTQKASAAALEKLQELSEAGQIGKLVSMLQSMNGGRTQADPGTPRTEVRE